MTASPKTLLNFADRSTWTDLDAYEGTIIFGGTGSGKTSGSGANIAKAFLRNGYGGLVLTAKVDEENHWRRYLSETGRDGDLIVMSPSSDARINFLEYESKRPGLGAGLTYELVRILKTAMEGGRERGKSENPYWEDAVAQLLTNAVDLVRLSGRAVSLPNVLRVIRTAPSSLEDVQMVGRDDEWRNRARAERGQLWVDHAYCYELLNNAIEKTRGTADFDDFNETWDYFMSEWAGLDARTRSTILSTMMSQLTTLLRTPFRQMFSTTTTVTPENTFDGKIVLLNLPIKEFGEAGRLAQVIFKTIWQRAAERRGSYGRPVFLWADEAQYFVTKYDMMFQQTARSSRTATVYLTQSTVNLSAALDSPQSTAISNSLLGNFQTKIFHANACPETNQFAERLFGSTLQKAYNANFGPIGAGGYQKQMLPVLPAIKFTTPKRGGNLNNNIVEGYIFQAGRTWNDDPEHPHKNWLLAQFNQ